ncbi:hypothetical protein FRC10_010738 [Ceratobasidium sp. 414]|nr:hypothetical protein FRC10_010738 [Ceratobasidium sp. 414]
MSATSYHTTTSPSTNSQMAHACSLNNFSPWKPEDQQPPWTGFEKILFGPLGHAQGFEQYENGQDLGVVWTASKEQGASVTVAETPTKKPRPRPRMRPPPPANEEPASAPELDDDFSPARKRRQTKSALTMLAFQTPGASSAGALAKLPTGPRTPVTLPGAPKKLLAVVMPTSASKRPSLAGPASQRSKGPTGEEEDKLDE